MLTGLTPITSGHAWILNHDIKDPTEMNEVRKHLGICPQHDVLWDRMSTEEHLWFFARLKGVPKDKAKIQVDMMLKKTHLDRDHNKDKFPTQMSGGQRRKLSLAIALIGGSQIVFLDEPTSGMDPQNRRITWELIQSEKRNRSIILTTHFMDEADILGDRIAIMATGQVKCCGTNSFLKQLYGVGYTLTVSLNLLDDFDKKNVNNIKKDIDQIVFDHVTKAEVVALSGAEITYRLPFESTSQFSTLFNLLDDNGATLKVKTYGISVTTLEEVFLKVGHDEIEPVVSKQDLETIEEKEEKDGKIKEDDDNLDSFELSSMNRCAIFFYHIYAILYKRSIWNLRDKQALFCQLFCPVVISLFGFSIGAVTLNTLTTEPAMPLHPTTWYPSANDIYIPTTNHNGSFPGNGTDWWEIPSNFYQDNNEFYNIWDDSYFNENNGELLIKNTSIDVDKYFNENTTNWKGWWLKPFGSVYPSTYGVTHKFQNWLLEETRRHNEPIYMSFFFVPYSMTTNQQKRVYFGINGSAIHGLPIAVNLYNNWILNYIFDEYLEGEESVANLSISTHPLPPTHTQSIILQYFLAFQQSIYFVIAFSFIPAGAIYFIVNEKSAMTKHQQLVSGVSYTSYWVANYIMDVSIGYPAIILVICFVYIFNSFVYEESIGWFSATLVLFLWSSTPFTYLLSFLFSSPSQAQFTTIMLYMVLGMVMGLVCLGLELMSPETQDISQDILRPIFRIFPPFILCESLINIGIKIVLYPFSDFKDWEVLGRNFTFMIIEGVGYFTLVLIIEYLSTYPVLLRKCGLITNMTAKQRDDDLDSDVWFEKQRIKDGITQVTYNENADQAEVKLKKGVDELKSDSVIIAGLRKVFKQRSGGKIQCCNKNVKKFEAVKGLYFGVKQSECFGFLGVNGAGKTTTLSTMTGAQYPSTGTAFICGNDIVRQQLKCRRYIGYVPQFDALFDLLNCEEHLKFYGMLKGLKKNIYNKQMEILLHSLTLQKYRKRLSHTYSGGNKRKLSVALAMIGNPPVIFLDEPSTGMDPVSRRAMWTFISSTMKNRCVILTTHSMDECEALCQRIGIMVFGQLQCIGNAQHLKTRFGDGYQLDLNLLFEDIDDNQEEEILQSITAKLSLQFGEITLIEHNGNRFSYELPTNNNNNNEVNKLGQMFDKLENMKNNEYKCIDSYALSQTTLEQVFLRMAKTGEELKRLEWEREQQQS